MLSAVLDLIFPVHCHVCRAPLGDGGTPYLCPRHAAGLIREKNREPDLCCLYRYEGEIPSLIRAFKYGSKRFLVRCFEGLLKEALTELPSEDPLRRCDLAVAVPMDPRKQKERGFNQAELLASCAVHHLGIPLEKQILRRRGADGSQAALTREARLENILGTIVPGKKGEAARGKNLLLVDDVVTTGATIGECIRVLRCLGARSVAVLALARTPLHLINSPN